MSVKRNEVWKKFYEDVYSKEVIALNQTIVAGLAKKRKEYQQQFCTIVKRFISSVNAYNPVIMKPIGSIEISVLRYSVYEDKLQLAFEAFDEKQDVGECVAGYQVEVDWLSEEFSEHKKKLLKLREGADWIREIHEEDIYVMLQDTMGAIVKLLVGFFKYSLEGVETWEEYQKLNKTDFFFYISMGEYRDKQYLLFVSREKFDLLTVNSAETSRYGAFSDCVYKNNTISGLDIRNSFFQNCTFEKMKIAENLMTDSKFFDCTFYRCDLKKLDFTGSLFFDCVFDECDFDDVIWYDGQRKDDFYRKTCVGGCKFIRCKVDTAELGKSEVLNLSMIEGERSTL